MGTNLLFNITKTFGQSQLKKNQTEGSKLRFYPLPTESEDNHLIGAADYIPLPVQ